MKKSILSFISILSCLFASAQEMTVEQAMARMKQTTQDYLTDAFTEKDETGADQFVDVEVTGIHDFSDFSYGALMKEFQAYLDSRIPMVKNARGETVKSSRAGDIEKRNARLLEYVRGNMTKIAAYSAVVDYNGITKFHEKKALSRLVFYDWKGDVIAFKDPMYSRNEFKSGLAPYMCKKAVSELEDMNDPLFLKTQYWISDVVNAEMAGRSYEMQWCYCLTKENIGDNSIDKGKFRLYYYQVQRGVLQVIKSITVIEGKYEKDSKHIMLTYKDAAVESFHVKAEEISSYSPGDYTNIDLGGLTTQLIESARFKKAIRALDNTPAVYQYVDDKTFSMTAPFGGDNPALFHLR